MKDIVRKEGDNGGAQARSRGNVRSRAVIALTVCMPFAFVVVSGCSLARSCASGRDGDSARPRLSAPVCGEPEVSGTAVSSEGAFAASPDDGVTGKRVVLRGSVVAFGSEPHVRAGFVLEDGSGTFELYPEARGREALALQGRLVEITAIVVDRGFASPSRFAQGDGVVYPLSWKIVN